MNKSTRLIVWHKYHEHCAYCGRPLAYDDMEVDHLIPQRLRWWYKNPAKIKQYNLTGTVDDIKNLMPSCRRCNHYKRSYLLEGFRKLMMTLHKRIMQNYICKVAVDYGIINVIPWDGVFYFEKQEMKRTKNRSYE